MELFERWTSLRRDHKARRRFLSDHFASEGSLRQIDRTRNELLRQLKQLGFVSGSYCNANATSTAVLLTVITAGLYVLFVGKEEGGEREREREKDDVSFFFFHLFFSFFVFVFVVHDNPISVFW